MKQRLPGAKVERTNAKVWGGACPAERHTGMLHPCHSESRGARDEESRLPVQIPCFEGLSKKVPATSDGVRSAEAEHDAPTHEWVGIYGYNEQKEIKNFPARFFT